MRTPLVERHLCSSCCGVRRRCRCFWLLWLLRLLRLPRLPRLLLRCTGGSPRGTGGSSSVCPAILYHSSAANVRRSTPASSQGCSTPCSTRQPRGQQRKGRRRQYEWLRCIRPGDDWDDGHAQQHCCCSHRYLVGSLPCTTTATAAAAATAATAATAAATTARSICTAAVRRNSYCKDAARLNECARAIEKQACCSGEGNHSLHPSNRMRMQTLRSNSKP